MSGLVLRVRVSLLSGHRLLRIPLMLVMRGLVSSVYVALPSFATAVYAPSGVW